MEADFLSFGMAVKVENVARSLEDVEWCQSRLVEMEVGEWTFARDWTKVLGLDLAGAKFLASAKGRKRLAKTIGVGELSGFAGLPILQEYSLALIREAGDARLLDLDSTDDYQHRFVCEGALEKTTTGFAWGSVTPRPITSLARRSFAKAYGVSPGEQIDMERRLRKWKIQWEGEQMIASYERTYGSDGLQEEILTTPHPFVYPLA